MLHVKTRLGLSTIEGIGLFADQDISQGALVWSMGLFDMFIDEETAKTRFLGPAYDEFIKYSPFDEKRKCYMLLCDNARFMNHSPKPNLTSQVNTMWSDTYAGRDIFAGEELTENYETFNDTPYVGFETEGAPLLADSTVPEENSSSIGDELLEEDDAEVAIDDLTGPTPEEMAEIEAGK